MSIIPVYKRLRQEDCPKFKVDLGYIVNSEPAWTIELRL